MEKIAFFGAGLLGSGFIEALRKRGVEVNVWNRTHDKAAALERFGANAFHTPAQAVAGVDRVHMCLSSDDAVDAVLAQILPVLAAGVPIVDHTTVSVAGVRARQERMAKDERVFLHAPVFMGPQNAAHGTGIMMASGDREVFERLRPALEPMTGDLWFVSERGDEAALFKLAGNAMILAVVGGLNDIFTIAHANNIPRQELLRVFERFKPEGQISGRGKRMASEEYEPSWTMTMAHKDAKLMQAAASGDALPSIDAMESLMRRCIDAGFGHDDLGAIARR